MKTTKCLSFNGLESANRHFAFTPRKPLSHNELNLHLPNPLTLCGKVSATFPDTLPHL